MAYEAEKERALSAISRKGGPITILRFSNASADTDAGDRWEGDEVPPQEYNGYALMLDFDLIEQGMRRYGKKFYIAAKDLGVVPQEGDQILGADGVRYRILHNLELAPNMVDHIMYECEVVPWPQQ